MSAEAMTDAAVLVTNVYTQLYIQRQQLAAKFFGGQIDVLAYESSLHCVYKAAQDCWGLAMVNPATFADNVAAVAARS